MSLSVFELLMLVCFGAAWPLNIYKSIKSKSTKGKSLIFLFVINAGYICGIIHKIVYSFDGVIFLYILNFLMVTVDILLFFRNRKFENAALPA
ncbi:MAG TPA: hypothetical protein DCO79_13700 [Spirochaeta sp.]|nr:hypothetical protein [Spirochaeta sp.]